VKRLQTKKRLLLQDEPLVKTITSIMTYFYSESTLLSFSIPQLKETALAQGVTVTSYPNRKSSWVAAILLRQALLIPVADTEELIIDEAPIVATEDRAICQELGLELINPYPSVKGHIEPSGSIVAEVEQGGRYLGAIRRYYTAAGIFYTPNCRWTGLEYPTVHAAALSLISDSDIEIAKATIERDAKIAPPIDNTVIPVYSNGIVFNDSVIPCVDRVIGTIERYNGRYKVCVTGVKGSYNIDTLDGAAQGVKLGWANSHPSPAHKRLWREYLGLPVGARSF
jgi:hypothetical protein